MHICLWYLMNMRNVVRWIWRERAWVLLNHLKMTMMYLHLRTTDYSLLIHLLGTLRAHTSAAADTKGKPMPTCLLNPLSTSPGMAMEFLLTVLSNFQQLCILRGPCLEVCVVIVYDRRPSCYYFLPFAPIQSFNNINITHFFRSPGNAIMKRN